MRQSVQDMVKNKLSPVLPVECTFKTGDTVTSTNEYGTTDEVIGMAKKAAADIVAASPVLTAFIN